MTHTIVSSFPGMVGETPGEALYRIYVEWEPWLVPKSDLLSEWKSRQY